MSFWISFVGAALLMGLNLAGLAWITSRLGRGAKSSAYAGYASLAFIKLGVLGLALWALIRSPWFQFAGLFLGLGAPVLGLAIWQMTRLGKK